MNSNIINDTHMHSNYHYTCQFQNIPLPNMTTITQSTNNAATITQSTNNTATITQSTDTNITDQSIKLLNNTKCLE